MEWNQVHLRRSLIGCECPQGKDILIRFKTPVPVHENDFSLLGFFFYIYIVFCLWDFAFAKTSVIQHSYF